jgi:hypothetical protein
MANKKPIGRAVKKPVIAVRVPAPLHQRIVKSAKRNGRCMSEEMAALLEAAFAWQDAHGDRVRMLQEAKAQCERLVSEQLKIDAERRIQIAER